MENLIWKDFNECIVIFRSAAWEISVCSLCFSMAPPEDPFHGPRPYTCPIHPSILSIHPLWEEWAIVDSSAVVLILLSSAPWDLCFKDLSIHSSPHNFIRLFLDPVRATGNSLFQQKRPKSVLVREVSGGNVYRWVKMVHITLQTLLSATSMSSLSEGLPVRGAHLTLAEGPTTPRKVIFPTTTLSYF